MYRALVTSSQDAPLSSVCPYVDALWKLATLSSGPVIWEFFTVVLKGNDRQYMTIPLKVLHTNNLMLPSGIRLIVNFSFLRPELDEQ
jgi:hypothetical protein